MLKYNCFRQVTNCMCMSKRSRWLSKELPNKQYKRVQLVDRMGARSNSYRHVLNFQTIGVVVNTWLHILILVINFVKTQ